MPWNQIITIAVPVGAALVILAVGVAALRDLLVDYAKLNWLLIYGSPHVVKMPPGVSAINVDFGLEDTSWFIGNGFGPRRGISWRIVVEPRGSAASAVNIRPRPVEQGGSNKKRFVVSKAFDLQWDGSPGRYEVDVTLFINNKKAVEKRIYVNLI